MPDTERAPLEPNPDISALAELTLCACAMLPKLGFWEHADALPEPSDFDDGDLAELWTAILEARKHGQPSRMIVARQLRELGWDEAHAFKALERANVGYVKLAEGLEAAKVLLSRRLRRQAMRVLSETLKELPTVHNVQEAVHRHERAIADLASRSDGADGWVSGEDVHDTDVERVPSGFDDCDRVNGGLPVGELTIGAGRTGMGKTAWAVSLMLNVARAGYGVGCFSLEMATPRIMRRMAAAEAYDANTRLESGRTTNPYYADYDKGVMNQADARRFEQALGRTRKLPVMWDDKRGRTLSQVKLGARRLKSRFDADGKALKLLVVDHIGKVRPDRTTGNRHLDLGDITESLAALASDLNIAVVGLCQLSRDVEKRDDKRPRIDDLRESGRIEEDAHDIWIFYRPAYYFERARDRGEEVEDIGANRFVIEADLAKNRGGPIKRVPLFCEIGANAILDKAKAPTDAMGGML